MIECEHLEIDKSEGFDIWICKKERSILNIVDEDECKECKAVRLYK